MNNVDLTGLPADILLRKSRQMDESLDEIFRIHKPRLIDLAERHSLDYTIHEDVISGTKSTDASAILGRVMTKSDAGLSRVWVCMDIDRLARPNLEEVGRIINCVQRNNIYILTPGRIYQPDSVEDEFLALLQFILARHEVRKYSERVVRARTQITLKESRYSNGRAPFGYTWNGNTKSYDPDPITYPMVEYAWSLIRVMGAASIWKRLKEAYPDYDLKWTRIFYMFRNPFYAGYPCKRCGKDYRLQKEQSAWIWPESPGDYVHPVNLEEWQEIQALMTSRNLNKTKTQPNTWARGVLLHEPTCTKMFGCARMYAAHSDGWGSNYHYISMRRVHDFLEFILEQIFDNQTILKSMIRQAERSLTQSNMTRHEKIKQLQATREAKARKENQMKRLIAAYSEDLSSDALRIFDNQIKEWENEAGILAQQCEDLQASLAMTDLTPELLEALKQIGSDFRVWWPELYPAERKAIADMVFETVVISREGEKQRPYISDVRLRIPFDVLIPPPALRGQAGLSAARLALRDYNRGKVPSRAEWLESLGIDKAYTRELYNFCREWLDLPNWR
jgi:DNA invertase Pin-like site-specific DNA recombinase